MRTSMKLLTLLASGGVSAPANTLAPAIGTTSTIGTQINGDDGTWTNPQSYTYQWQRNTGSWGDIGGATSKNYTPVDADFGYALRLVVTTGGVSANSNATNLTQEAPAITFTQKLANNGMSADTDWAKGVGWTIAAGVAAHTGAGNSVLSQAQATEGAGEYYSTLHDITARTSGEGRPRVGVTSGAGFSAVGTYRSIIRKTTTDTTLGVFGTSTFEGSVDNIFGYHMALNTQLVAPSAQMRIDQFYTLPVTPVAGTQVWVMPRISDFANGNYWVALLSYTGSQWDITLYSVAAFSLTSVASATNISTTNGIRIDMNGNSIKLFTTANGGTNWTQRDTTKTNSTYNAATGVNTMWTPDVTMGLLVFDPNPT